MTLAVGDKVKIEAPGIYGDGKEGVVKEVLSNRGEDGHAARVEFFVFGEDESVKDDCSYYNYELKVLKTLEDFSVEELSAELERRALRAEAEAAAGRFQARIRALPVGAIFLSPFTGEPVIRLSEDAIRHDLLHDTPRDLPLPAASNQKVAPLVVIFPLADSE